MTCVTMRELIALAWKLHPDNVQGGDARALAVPYDLRATVPDGPLWTRESVRPLLRQLLMDRFHVEGHSGTKQIAGYGLAVAKGGAKLKPAKVDSTQQGSKGAESPHNYIIPGYIYGRGVTLEGMAALLASAARATVEDHTGISGVFDVDLHFASEGAGAEANLPDLFTAVEEQLGLTLRPEKVVGKTFVIDRMDGEPTPN